MCSHINTVECDSNNSTACKDYNEIKDVAVTGFPATLEIGENLEKCKYSTTKTPHRLSHASFGRCNSITVQPHSSAQTSIALPIRSRHVSSQHSQIILYFFGLKSHQFSYSSCHLDPFSDPNDLLLPILLQNRP